jgi:hypothetical protein
MASQTIEILCGQCGAFIVRYQKKGSGQMIKLYLDRIIGPDYLSRLKFISKKIDLPILACTGCGNRVGLRHEGGAYRMIKGSFRRGALK